MILVLYIHYLNEARTSRHFPWAGHIFTTCSHAELYRDEKGISKAFHFHWTYHFHHSMIEFFIQNTPHMH